MKDRASEDMLAWLRRGVNFEVVSSVSFDDRTGRLTYRHDHDPQDAWRDMVVLQAFHAAFAAVSPDMARIDFQGVEGHQVQGFRLVLDDSGGPGAWNRALLIRHPTDRSAPMPGMADLDNSMAPAMAAHELKQPLFTISMAAKSIELMLAHQRPDDEQAAALDGVRQAAARIRLQVERAHAIMASIMGDTKQAQQERNGDVRQAIEHALDFLHPLLDQHQVEVAQTLLGEPLWVPLPQIALEQVLVNAIQNAVDSMISARSQGIKCGELYVVALRDAGRVHCQVKDDGQAPAAALSDNVFNPFFTTKSSQGSFGLGLHISRQIVTRAGGTIDLLANSGQGATLSLTLPAIECVDQEATI